MITKQERLVLTKLAEAYNHYIDLPIIHQSSQREFEQIIHQAQNIVLAREGLRKLREGE